jgi:tetratricopeptide (TPR) repeat protein
MPATSINPDRIKNITYLANCISQKHDTFSDKPKYALLIGAGCSFSSGVPLGGGIIKLCQQLAYLYNETTTGKSVITEFYKKGDHKKLDQYITNNHKKEFEAFIVLKNEQLTQRINKDKDEEEKKLREFLPKAIWSEYEAAIATDAQYGYWQDVYSEDPKERQQLIERLIETKEPGGAYILLAYLVENGFFSNILTTNFDDFINDALLYYTDVRCRFYADDELSQYISLVGKKPNIVKLHGDYRFANMKNTNDETRRLSANLEQKMGELLKEFGLVVMGYNGADHSIMNTLLRIKQNSPYSLIWCGMDENKVHWRVAELINNSRNSFFVKMEGFDQMMGQLFTEFCKDSKPYNLVQKAKERQQKVSNLLKQFGRELNKSTASNETKKGFYKILNTQELLEQAYNENNNDKAIKLYNQVLKIDPANVIAFHNRGHCWQSKKEYDRAFNDYAKSIQLDPNAPESYNSIADIFRLKGELGTALEKVLQALQKFPQYAPLHGTLAEIYAQQGNAKKFYTTLKKAFELGYPVWEELDDEAYTPYKNEQRFIELLAKYKKE